MRVRRVTLSLRARIVILVVGLVVVTMTASTLTSVRGEADLRRRSAEAQLAHCAMLIALDSPLISGAEGDQAWLRFQETLQRAQRIRLSARGTVFEVAYSVGFDAAGKVRAKSLNPLVLDLRLPGGEPAPALTRTLLDHLVATLERDPRGLLIVRVERNAGPVLEIGYSRTQLSAAIREMWLRAAWLTALFALLGALLANLLAATLARPIELLARSMRRVADGDLTAGVAIRRHDEVGVLADSFNAMLDGLRERERIRDRFGRYVSPDVVAKILSDPERLTIAGERRRVAVLFVDIRGFTSLAESLPPDDVVELVNGVFGAVWRPVSVHGGTIDKFLGDGVMVLFNAPLDQDGFALAAAAAALEIQHAVHELSTHRRRHDQAEIGVGIGLNIAEVVAGSFGTAERMEYTVVGDGVNIAARLEDQAAAGETLLSAEARAALGDAAVCEPAGRRALKGRVEPVEVYRLVGLRVVGEGE